MRPCFPNRVFNERKIVDVFQSYSRFLLLFYFEPFVQLSYTIVSVYKMEGTDKSSRDDWKIPRVHQFRSWEKKKLYPTLMGNSYVQLCHVTGQEKMCTKSCGVSGVRHAQRAASTTHRVRTMLVTETFKNKYSHFGHNMVHLDGFIIIMIELKLITVWLTTNHCFKPFDSRCLRCNRNLYLFQNLLVLCSVGKC